MKERLDNKGRVLWINETQKKNGTYMYRYMDKDGKRRCVYSKRLEKDDPPLPGNKDKVSLREYEARIQRSLARGIRPVINGKVTFNDMWEHYLSMKCEIAESTLVGYIYLYNHRIRKVLGFKQINRISYTDLKEFYIDELKQGMSLSSLTNINNIISPVFQLAIREGYIVVNPSEGLLAEFKRRKNWNVEHKEALTEQQQAVLVDYVSKSYEFKEWMPVLTVLLGTGLRIGELLGLRWDDIDFERNQIHVTHTLNYQTALDGKCQFYITFPKTKAGVRDIPMLADVREVFEMLYDCKDDFNCNSQIVIDGYSNFIFRDLYGNVISSSRVNSAWKRITKKYNEQESKRAAEENRPPVLLPDFTCHNLRHTFCTRAIESGEITLKTLQYIMGHAHAETTIRVYSSVTDEHNREEITALNGILKIK